MLHTAPDHPKTLALQAALGCGRAQVIGHLELLWLFTAEYAPAGDIGRWPDEAIAQACGWQTEGPNSGPASAFIEALVKVRFLDRDEKHRLLVHDWRDHAQRHVLRKLARRGSSFASSASGHGRATAARKVAKRRPVAAPLTAPTLPYPTGTLPHPTPPDTELPATVTVAGVPVSLEGAWSKQACDLWIARFGGTAPGGKIGKALQPLLAKHPWEALAPAWAAYLTDAEARWASAQRFADTLSVWLPSARPTRPPEPREELPPADLVGPSLWNEIAGHLQQVLPPHSWATWIRPIRGVRLDRDTPNLLEVLTVTAPGREWRQQLKEIYAERLREATKACGRPRIQFRVLMEPPT